MPVPLTRNRHRAARSHIIRAGGSESISFAFQVSAPGLYLLSFRGLPDEEVVAEAEKLGASEPVVISTSKYIWVDETPVGTHDLDAQPEF